MALNEHDPSGPSILGELAVPTLPQSDEERLVMRASDIVARAEAAVEAGEREPYAAALADIPRITDIHRRHQARLRSIERVLLPRPGLSPTSLSRLMLSALDALIAWLDDTPAEPTLLGYAGVLATELGLYKEAEALFAAALRLDPAREDHESSLQAARSRRKIGAKVLGLPGDVRHGLPSRRPRLTKIAASARPAVGMRVSLCMIVRDEEEWLGRCLEAAREGVDEMIIVDTGSRDRTVEIAESFGATVLFHEWTGDFSEARNIGLNAATGDWIVWLDADEIFADGDGAKLRELASRTWRECYRMDMVHFLGDADDGEQAMHAPWKLFRNRPEYRFKDRIHEQIGHAFPGYLLSERFEHAPLRIDHYGYLGQVRSDRGKSDRNLKLLLGQLEDGDDSAFMHFNLGSEYSVIAGEEAQGKALEHLRIAYHKVTDDLDFKLQGFLPALVLRFVRALRAHQLYDEMEEACELIHQHFPKFTDVVYEQALAAFDQQDWATARARFERCLELGDAPAIYSPTVGCGSHLAELRLAQIDLHEGQDASAIERFRTVRAEHPDYLGLIDPYATVLLARGDRPSEVLAALTEGHDLSPSGWFMVGVNFQERGHLAQAEAAFRGALERRPALDQARVALADALLVQGRVVEALAEAEQVPADVRVGGAALRTAIFARLALEDDALNAGLSPLAAQLGSSNLDEPTAQLLRALVARRLGTPPPVLGRVHVDALTPLLDALLRLGAADAFAEGVDVLADTGVDRRTQHEVLATLFLVRGLTEMAADEWIAAIQESGGDAAAFAGLAEVARLQGLPDDARTLAAEALGLEPEHRLAQRVLEAVGA
jgi:glycosyltransferase involved in cell wall biosynthesis/Tfp pilus assembly protein PilF